MICISDDIGKAVSTSAATEELFSSDDYRAKWDQLIDEKLIEWGRAPEELEDDGVYPPSRESLSKACKVANDLKSQIQPPTWVVPNGDGGLVFQWDSAIIFEFLHDGQVSFLFRRALVHR